MFSINNEFPFGGKVLPFTSKAAKRQKCRWTLTDAEIYFGQSHSPHFPSAPHAKKVGEKDPPRPRGDMKGEQRREREKVGRRSKLSQFLLSTKKMAAAEERPRPHSPFPPLPLLLLLPAREIDGFLNAPVTFIAPPPEEEQERDMFENVRR